MWKNVLKLFLASIFLLVSCAPVKVQMPSYEGKTFRQVLSGMKNVSGVETRFSIVSLRDGRERKGDAALDLAQNGDMSLRVYSLGFLAMDLSSRNGNVKSSRPIAPGRYLLLTRGLRACFFWWDMKDNTLAALGGRYILSDAWRTVWVDKSTFLPVRQKVHLADGREIDIRYDRPRRNGDVWFQSRIRIEYNGYSLTLSVSHMSFQRSSHHRLSSEGEEEKRND
jgi:hypothetical protein